MAWPNQVPLWGWQPGSKGIAMKAAVYTGMPTPGTIGATVEIRDVPEPALSDGELLLAIDSCCVCGTDLRTFRHGDPKIQPPRILGHEFCGRVIESRARDSNVRVGDRVVMYIVLVDGVDRYTERGRENLSGHRTTISYHHDGAFAPRMTVPALAVRNGCMFPVTGDMPSEQMALAEPLGCCCNAHSRLDIGPADTVAIIGAGPIGIMHACLARIQGARNVFVLDTNPSRLDKAKEFDIDAALLSDGSHGDELRRLNGGEGADVVVVAVSSGPAMNDALDIATKGGRICFFAGLPKTAPDATLNVNQIHYKELDITGSYSEKKRDFERAFALLNSGAFPAEKIVTHRLPLERVTEAFPLMESGEALKVCIEVLG
jgi:L-iditol 2-dehydrogenase